MVIPVTEEPRVRDGGRPRRPLGDKKGLIFPLGSFLLSNPALMLPLDPPQD